MSKLYFVLLLVGLLIPPKLSHAGEFSEDLKFMRDLPVQCIAGTYFISCEGQSVATIDVLRKDGKIDGFEDTFDQRELSDNCIQVNNDAIGQMAEKIDGGVAIGGDEWSKFVDEIANKISACEPTGLYMVGNAKMSAQFDCAGTTFLSVTIKVEKISGRKRMSRPKSYKMIPTEDYYKALQESP